jgi:hypothetical protein
VLVARNPVSCHPPRSQRGARDRRAGLLWQIGFYAIFACVMYLAMGILLRGLASRTSSQGDSARA